MTLRLRGSSSQYVDITASPNAGDATLTLPTTTGTVRVAGGVGVVDGDYTVATGATISGSTNTIDFRTGNSSFVRIDSSARLSVGGAGSIDSQFQVVNSSQDVAESVVRFESAAASSGFSQSLVHVYKGNGYGGAIGGYINQGVGHGLTLNTVNNGTLSERLRITSAGDVGIGSTNPTHPLEVHSGGATNIVAKSTNGNGGFLNYSGLSNNGTTTFSVNHNGTIYTASGLNFGTAVSPVTSQTLDDYEEGNFDPSFTSAGGTLTSNNTALNYVKVGRMVTVAGRIYVNGASAPTGTVTITLPFTFTTTPNTGSGNPYMTHGLAYLHGQSFPLNYQRAFWELSSGTNKAALYFERDNQGWTTFDGPGFSQGDYVTVNITYFTDL